MVQRKSQIHVIGTDGSGLENLPLHLTKTVLSAKGIAGPKRLLDHLPKWWLKQVFKENLPIPELFPSESPKDLIKWLKKQAEETVLLASGDPLWFGIGRMLIEELPEKNLSFHPSPTSFQLAFARLGRSWQDASWISLHGRESTPLFQRLKERHKALVVLTDPQKGGVAEVREYLRTAGLEDNYSFWICEKLGNPNERVTELLPTDSIRKDIDPLNLVILLENKSSIHKERNLPLFGIEDGIFRQYEDRSGLMTKREVRVQLLTELELPKEGTLWDIGAGVGSVGLEALRLRPNLKLVSIEKRAGAKALIKSNAILLKVDSCKVVEEDALHFLSNINRSENYSRPDRVLLGGGGANKEEILRSLVKLIRPNGIIVIPLATLEAVSKLKDVLLSFNFSTSISQHQTSRGVLLGEGTRLAPMNPVFIIKGKHTEGN